ncbi:O-antigen ligase family protein [Microbacterium sp. NPDC016588]
MTPGSVAGMLACAIAIVATLRASSEAVIGRAVAACLVIVTVVPATAISDDVTVVTALASAIFVCVVAFLRKGVRAPSSPLFGVVLFVGLAGWLTLRTLGQFSEKSTLLQVGVLASAVAVALIVPYLTASDLPVLANAFALSAVAHAAFAVLEQLRIVDAVWQLRGTGDQGIADRDNVIFSALVGRSQTSFAHPILLAFFLCVALIFLLHATIRLRRARYALAAICSVIGLVCSGTRSAVVAIIFALCVYAVASIRWRRLLGIFAFFGVVAIVALQTDLPRVLALDSRFESSVSFIHRSQVLGSVGDLWAMGWEKRLFGSGVGATAALFDRGIVTGARGLYFFDNTWISMFALTGLISVALLAAVLLWALRGGALAIALATFIGVMGMSFDEQTWQLPMVLLALVALLPPALGTNANTATDVDGERGERRPTPSSPAERGGRPHRLSAS